MTHPSPTRPQQYAFGLLLLTLALGPPIAVGIVIPLLRVLT